MKYTENASAPSLLNTLEIGNILNIIFNSRKTLSLIFLLCLSTGVIAGIVSGPMYTTKMQIEVNTGSSEVSPKQKILLANSTLTNPTIAKAVINKLKLMPSGSDGISNAEQLNEAVERYGKRLTVRNIPSSDVFDINAANELPEDADSIVKQHFTEYLEYEQRKSDQEYRRMGLVLDEAITQSRVNLREKENELSKFAKDNNITDLELDDRDLVEFNGFDKPKGPSTLPPDVQTSLDVLKRIYIQNRSQYFSYVGQRRALDFNYQSATPSAIILSEPSYPEKSYPSVMKLGMVGVFIGSLICFILLLVLTFKSYKNQ